MAKKSRVKSQYREGLRWLLYYLKDWKSLLILLITFSIFEALANATVPYLAGRIIDSLINGTADFLLILGIWAAIKLVADIFDWQISSRSNRFEESLHTDYVSRAFSTLLYFPLSFHKRHKLGEVTNRIERAASNLAEISADLIVDLAPQFLSIIFALAFTFYVKPLLAAVLLGAVILYAIFVFWRSPRLAVLYPKLHKAYNDAFGDAYDTLLNISAVKQATAEEREKKKMNRNFKIRALGLQKQIIDIRYGLNFGQRILISLTQLAIFLISWHFIRIGEMTVGQLVMFNGYAAMLFGPFVVLANRWNTVQNGFASLVRAERILASPQEKYLPQMKNRIITPFKGEVVFKNVSFNYGLTKLTTDNNKRELVLNNVNFNVRPGEKVALVGQSGVGKSTLVDLISHYYLPTKGRIFIDGYDIKNIPLKTLRSQIAIVPQELLLFNDTVSNNIAYGNFGADSKSIKETAKLAHADEFIGKFPKKYNQLVGERGIRLSVGQKQRIAIARAILRNPKILILDEPTSALDAQSEVFIQESLRKLMENRTTFIIAHRFSTVRKADKILVLEKGTIAESGTHDELMQKPGGIYRHLYELQTGLT